MIEIHLTLATQEVELVSAPRLRHLSLDFPVRLCYWKPCCSQGWPCQWSLHRLHWWGPHSSCPHTSVLGNLTHPVHPRCLHEAGRYTRDPWESCPFLVGQLDVSQGFPERFRNNWKPTCRHLNQILRPSWEQIERGKMHLPHCESNSVL